MHIAPKPHLPSTLHDPAACQGCEVRRSGICRVLDPDNLSQMARVSSRRVVARGEPIHRVGLDDDVVANLLGGAVSLARCLPDGRQQIVGLQFPPSLVGNFVGVDDGLDTVARETVRLCVIPRHDFETIISRSPELEHAVLHQVGLQLDEARTWLLAIGRKSASERVATFLDMVARHRAVPAEEGGEYILHLPLSRGAMADFLGLTIETVSRKMTELRRTGIIDFSDATTVRILSRQRLKSATGDVP